MDNDAEALEWFRLAAMELESSMYLSTMYPVPNEIICYHCQQSAEKNLKGYLVLHGMTPPKTHDLDELCKLCLEIKETFSVIADQCSGLSAYGVQEWYPTGQRLKQHDMQQALDNASAINSFVLNLSMLLED